MPPSPSSATDVAQQTPPAHSHGPNRLPPPEPFPRLLPWLLLVGGLLGAAAAFVLTVEKIALITDPEFIPSCSLNPILNCGSIMKTDQAELLGFPNPLIGLITFPVLAATGALLLARVRLPRWYWLGLQAGATLAVVFVGWLIFQSLYRIDALCPYCMVVWAVVANHALALTLVAVTIAGLIAHRFWDYWSSLVA